MASEAYMLKSHAMNMVMAECYTARHHRPGGSTLTWGYPVALNRGFVMVGSSMLKGPSINMYLGYQLQFTRSPIGQPIAAHSSLDSVKTWQQAGFHLDQFTSSLIALHPA